MKVFDSVNKTEVEVDGTKGLIQLMKDGRQVDLHLKEKKSDEDGYMSWDVEHWSSVDGKRFIRCYSLEGRVLSESTGHNIYDLANDFKPEEAMKVELCFNERKMLPRIEKIRGKFDFRGKSRVLLGNLLTKTGKTSKIDVRLRKY